MKTLVINTKYHIREGPNLTSYFSIPLGNKNVVEQTLCHIKNYIGHGLKNLKITIEEKQIAS